MKQTTPKYLNALQHSLSWFWISSLAGLAEQGCILGFGSGSGQLQFQAKREICCSHEGAMELQAVLWKFAIPLSASVQDPKDHFYPLPKELTWLSPSQWRGLLSFHQLWTMAGVGKYEKLYTNSNIYHTSFYSFFWCTKTQSDGWSPSSLCGLCDIESPKLRWYRRKTCPICLWTHHSNHKQAESDLILFWLLLCYILFCM